MRGAGPRPQVKVTASERASNAPRSRRATRQEAAGVTEKISTLTTEEYIDARARRARKGAFKKYCGASQDENR